MQVDESGSLVEFGVIYIKFFIVYLGGNKISKVGCRWLSKSNLKKLCLFVVSKIMII